MWAVMTETQLHRHVRYARGEFETLPHRSVRHVTVVIVVRTDFLQQFVVSTEEVNVDADDFKGLGAEPGDVALRLFLEAHPAGVVGAKRRPLAPVGLLVLHPAVERLGVFMDVQSFLLGDLEVHNLGGGHQAHRDVAEACGVVTEVDAERAIAVVDDLARDEQVELDCLNMGMEVTPTEHLLEFARLDDGSPLGSSQTLFVLFCAIEQPSPQILDRELLGGFAG